MGRNKKSNSHYVFLMKTDQRERPLHIFHDDYSSAWEWEKLYSGGKWDDGVWQCIIL